MRFNPMSKYFLKEKLLHFLIVIIIIWINLSNNRIFVETLRITHPNMSDKHADKCIEENFAAWLKDYVSIF